MTSIATLNVRGLRDPNKRKEIFVYCYKKRFDIVLLQETHSIKDDNNFWRSEFGGEAIFSNGESNARGVAILFQKRLNAEIKKVSTDKSGRYIIVDCVINGKIMTIINVYAPNIDDSEFFRKLFSGISMHDCTNIVIVGDLNLVLNEKIDAINRKNNNVKAKGTLSSFMEEMMLVDIWRFNNAEKSQYSWFKRNPEYVAARLDYILLNHSLDAEVQQVKMIPAYKSDHSAVCLKLNIQEGAPRGPGFWKLNMSIFDHASNIEKINEVISDVTSNLADCEGDVIWEEMKAAVVKECKRIAQNQAKNFNKDFK